MITSSEIPLKEFELKGFDSGCLVYHHTKYFSFYYKIEREMLEALIIFEGRGICILKCLLKTEGDA